MYLYYKPYRHLLFHYHTIHLTFLIHHLLLIVIISISFGIGTVAIPSDTEMFLSYGTKATCMAQGVIIEYCAQAIVLYYSMLAVFSYLAVKTDFNEKILRRYEPWFHIIACILPLIFSSLFAVKGFLNPAGPWCSRNTNPVGCEGEECKHGNFRPYISCVLFLFICMITVATLTIVRVCVIEKRKLRDNQFFRGKKYILENERQKKARLITEQATLYIFNLIFVSSIILTSRVIQSVRNEYHFPSLILGSVIVTLQGCLSSIVYEKTRSKRLKKRLQPKKTQSREAKDTLVNEIRNSTTLRKSEESTRPSVNSFSIFDGTRRPSSVWAEFIISDSDDDGDQKTIEACIEA